MIVDSSAKLAIVLIWSCDSMLSRVFVYMDRTRFLLDIVLAGYSPNVPHMS